MNINPSLLLLLGHLQTRCTRRNDVNNNMNKYEKIVERKKKTVLNIYKTPAYCHHKRSSF